MTNNEQNVYKLGELGNNPIITPKENTEMAESGLHGPHALTTEVIDAVVKGVGPGAYALGEHSGQIFTISYVGRSDGDLAARLKQWAAGSKYRHFKFGFLPNSKAAFDKECSLFHDFGETKLDNAVHPARPNNTNWTCPRCRALG